jgi:hypothetical protein
MMRPITVLEIALTLSAPAAAGVAEQTLRPICHKSATVAVVLPATPVVGASSTTAVIEVTLGSYWDNVSGCAAPTDAHLTLTVACPGDQTSQETTHEFAVEPPLSPGLSFVSGNPAVQLTIPSSVKNEPCQLTATFALSFPDSTLYAIDATAIKCSPGATADSAAPRLGLTRIAPQPGPLTVARGDQIRESFAVINNDPIQAVEVDIEVSSRHVADRPASEPQDPTVFGLGTPDIDPTGFPVRFEDDYSTTRLIDDHSAAVAPRTAWRRKAILGPYDVRVFTVVIRSFSGSANGACNVVEMRASGQFDDGERFDVSAGATLAVADVSPQSNAIDLVDRVRSGPGIVAQWSAVTYDGLAGLSTMRLGNVVGDSGEVATRTIGADLVGSPDHTGLQEGARDSIRMAHLPTWGRYAVSWGPPGIDSASKLDVIIQGFDKSGEIRIPVVTAREPLRLWVNARTGHTEIRNEEGVLYYTGSLVDLTSQDTSLLTVDTATFREFFTAQPRHTVVPFAEPSTVDGLRPRTPSDVTIALSDAVSGTGIAWTLADASASETPVVTVEPTVGLPGASLVLADLSSLATAPAVTTGTIMLEFADGPRAWIPVATRRRPAGEVGATLECPASMAPGSAEISVQIHETIADTVTEVQFEIVGGTAELSADGTAATISAQRPTTVLIRAVLNNIDTGANDVDDTDGAAAAGNDDVIVSSTVMACTITVRDINAPKVVCPGDLELTTSTVPLETIAGVDQQIASPDVQDDDPDTTWVVVEPGQYNFGVNTIVGHAIDTSGNETTCHIGATLVSPDSTPPVLTCPATTSLTTSDDLMALPSATDESGIVHVSLKFDDANAAVVFIAIDDAGNASQCTTRQAGGDTESGCGVGMITPAIASLLLMSARRRRFRHTPGSE